MFEKLGKFVTKWIDSSPPWSNVYGLARTIIASTLALTLFFNNAHILFHPAAGIPVYPQCNGLGISIFCLGPSSYLYLNIARWVAIIILIIVASGWRPRITGIFLAWIAYSIQTSALTLDGGEQVAMVISILLLPLSLTDTRKWHWETISKESYKNLGLYPAMIAKLNLVFIRIQVSIIYFHAFAGKLYGEWLDGTAVYYYLNDSMLGALPLLSKPLNLLLESNFVVIFTWGTLVIELLLFAGILLSQKHLKYLLYLGILFHGGIAITIGLISFSLIMIASLILYLRPAESKFKFTLPKLSKRIKSIHRQGISKEVV